MDKIDNSNGRLIPYFFHPDHLGSSSYISQLVATGFGLDRGVVSQHMEYLPFGEAMMDEHINSRNSPFKYNGKELDEETGNYYYGARYYDPKLSNFISVDPLAEKTFSSYGYCYNNPIVLVDPDGKAPQQNDWKPDRNGNLIAEKGDNTKTLAKYLNRSVADVGKNFKHGGESIGANHQFKTGDKVDLNNNMTRSIERSKGVTSDNGNTKGWDSKNDLYRCDEASQMAIAGVEITPSNKNNYEQFTKNTSGFTEVNNFNDTKFGDGIAIIGEGSNQHIVANYGQSSDGTQYVYSKDGMFFKPQVKPLKEVVKSYGFEMSDVKYYQKTNQNDK